MDKIRALVARERPDVLEVNSPYLAMAGALVAGRAHVGIRTFFWHADFIDTYLRVMLERRVAQVLTASGQSPERAVRGADVALAPAWAAVRAMLHACDATFATSKWQVAKLRAHGVDNVIHVPFGVDKRVFSPDARSDARRRELAEGASTLLVGVGRFAVEKRWDVVIDAFRKTAREGARLVLFGDGPERAALEERARGLNVAFLGFEKDRARLASALASADLLVHGCPYETFGLGVAEAMSCGLPVVVPDEGGASERVDASCGEIYASRDADACAAAIARLLARDAGELRVSALRAAKGIGTLEDHFEDVLDAYRSLLARRAK